jgi:hypothetical protein
LQDDIFVMLGGVMGIRLRITEPFPGEQAEAGRQREPGMMWRYPPGDVPGRECWWIVLPGGTNEYMEISWRTTDRASAAPHEMWDVTGTPPLITVTPSIDVEQWENGVRAGSYWHGHITNGELVG